jgi:hypothetical protein
MCHEPVTAGAVTGVAVMIARKKSILAIGASVTAMAHFKVQRARVATKISRLSEKTSREYGLEVSIPKTITTKR